MGEYNEGINTLKNNIAKLKEQKYSLDQVLGSEDYADKILTKSYDALTEKLSKYQVALRATEAGSEDYIRIQNKIKQVNKDLAKFDRSDSTLDSKEVGKEAKYIQKILQELAEVKARLLQTEQEREIAAIRVHLARKLSEITANSKAEVELRKLLTSEAELQINAVKKKYADAAFKAEYDLDRQINDAKLANMDEYSLEYITRVLEMLDKELELQLRSADLTESQKQKIREIYALKEAKASGDFVDKVASNNLKFEEELSGLRLKCDADLARGKEKIALEV